MSTKQPTLESSWMSYYGFTLQELRELMELRGEEAKAKESGFLIKSKSIFCRKLFFAFRLLIDKKTNQPNNDFRLIFAFMERLF